MQTIRPYVYLLGGAIALALAGCQKAAIQPAPQPAPEPQAAPAIPAQQNLSADALFAFGKAQLKSADNAELDALAGKLKAASQIDSVHLLGYTDRIGSEQANQKLSAQRAQAVRDYLVAHGVPAGVIQAEGRGAADPVADCPDQKGKQLIACLAPNRRVVVNTTVSEAGNAAPVAAVAGKRSVTRTVWIGPHTVPCDGDNSGHCYRVRESENGPWKNWHGRIQNFDYVEGYDYELVVKAYRSDVKLEDQSKDPASRYVFSGDSGPFVVWVLDHVVSQRLHLGRR
ncbi:MAG TPA: OmpA family protein [Rhodanobacter sp.]|jgi:outer membrane protein OmpA-like peptidoglycan-associated protein|nr:OmpA family protein [Rhodanobacter sp.]